MSRRANANVSRVIRLDMHSHNGRHGKGAANVVAVTLAVAPDPTPLTRYSVLRTGSGLRTCASTPARCAEHGEKGNRSPSLQSACRVGVGETHVSSYVGSSTSPSQRLVWWWWWHAMVHSLTATHWCFVFRRVGGPHESSPRVKELVSTEEHGKNAPRTPQSWGRGAAQLAPQVGYKIK